MSANGIILLLKSLNSKSLKYEIRAKKEKSEQNRKKLDEDAMLCNTLWSDRRRLVTKKHLPFRVPLNVGFDPNFPQKFFFSFLALFSEKFRFPAKTFSAKQR